MVPKSTYDTQKWHLFHLFLLQKNLFQIVSVAVLHTLQLSSHHKRCIEHLSLTWPSILIFVISAVCDANLE